MLTLPKLSNSLSRLKVEKRTGQEIMFMAEKGERLD